MAQRFDKKGQDDGELQQQWDSARTLRWLFFGFAVQAPWNHVSSFGQQDCVLRSNVVTAAVAVVVAFMFFLKRRDLYDPLSVPVQPYLSLTKLDLLAFEP